MHAEAGQQITISSIVTAFAALVAAATFLWRVWQSWQTEKSRKQALANAVYHHVEKAIDILDDPALSVGNAEVRAELETNADYTPYILRSADADLTYEHIIGVMEWLDYAGEKAVAKYFYDQSLLHSISESFGSEYVRSWPTERKLKLFDLHVEQVKETLASAKEEREALGKMGKK